jgi:adhesin transport system membrane fusion protein
MAKLVKSGSKSKLELIDKEKEVNQIKNDLETTQLSIPRTKLSIEENKTLLKERKQAIKSDVSIELQEVVAEITKIKSRLVTDNDKLEKTTIKSPANGIIKQININTIGAVVQSGVDLIEIVPDSDILYVEAKIDPKDIAFISPDLEVLVKLTAYDFSIYGGLHGKIIEISADSIIDKESKDSKSYYKVVVKTDKNYLEYNSKKLIIIPGMVASVDIVTGKKTIMDFFLKPILKVKGGALHER